MKIVDSTGLKSVLEQLEREFNVREQSITADFADGILCLSGKLDHWKQMVDFCHKAAQLPGVRNVVSHIVTPDSIPTERPDPAQYMEKGVVDQADVVIIGAGVTGCAAARTLSKYQLNILVLDKESDICEGTTKANNGMIHSGYDSKPGTLKAVCCVEGNAMYSQWAKELGFRFNRTGSFVCGFNEE